MTTRTATLTCGNYGREGTHELTYAGRILVSTQCRACGYTIRHPHDDLGSAYLHDIEQRIASKPYRMLRRLRRHPVKFVLDLPVAVAEKPRKLIDEVRTLIRNDEQSGQHGQEAGSSGGT
jgi:DNA-directed RNA polymerase subunit L